MARKKAKGSIWLRLDSSKLSIIIDQPSKIANDLKGQMIELIVEGGQISYNYAKIGVHRSQLAGLLVIEGKVIATCCLKRPLNSYIQEVFKQAQVEKYHPNFSLELGYITTKSGYEGNKLCQKLLDAFIVAIPNQSIFATTRKDAMEHILQKYKFKQSGSIYKVDLKLFVLNTEVNAPNG